MKLHEYQYEFKDLISIVASKLHIPESAVERDYYIVLLLKNLENSEYADKCVFKGGTSLSKCYPGSIERFSEDIDLTFLGMELSDKACDKSIKQIEAIMTTGAQTDKITAERSNRSKSMYVWFANEDNKIKLEIGSSVRPDPYSKKTFKSYIHEFLEEQGAEDDIQKFELTSVTLNVLHIERTFIDKIMSVKRHAICESLDKKVRHIYDVTRLFTLPEIQDFLRDKTELKRLIRITKETDSYYLEKRGITKEYNPNGAYDFDSWKQYLTPQIRLRYETLHKDLLYTDEQQKFDDALHAFSDISKIFAEISE